MPKNEKWVVAYKRVYKIGEGKYVSAFVHNTAAGLEYKIGEIIRAKVGALFCLPDLAAVKDCPEGNTTLKVLARGATQAPDDGAVSTSAGTIAQFRWYWRAKRKGTFRQLYATVFYKEVIPVEEVDV